MSVAGIVGVRWYVGSASHCSRGGSQGTGLHCSQAGGYIALCCVDCHLKQPQQELAHVVLCTSVLMSLCGYRSVVCARRLQWGSLAM